MNHAPYTGRFAPSPTGELHLGSLLTAVASYCDARANKGRWLVRIEDIDPLREVPGTTDSILRTLERYGLHADGEILYQSRRHEEYRAALAELQQQGRLFWCTCSRKQLAEHQVYPGTCHAQRRQPDQPAALKAIVPQRNLCFDDRLQGRHCLHFGEQAGDFVVLRKEGFFAYHLAVVVDDAAQGITDIVRGSDLLDATPYHLLLQQWLGYPTPHYLHLPVIVNADGQKLSKQTFAKALPRERPGQILHRVLVLLGQHPPGELATATAGELLHWGASHWNPAQIPARQTIHASDTPDA